MAAKKGLGEEKTSVGSNALSTVTSYLSENKRVGMEEIDEKDLRIPTLSLIAINSNIEDGEGNRLATSYPGQFYYKGNNEIFKTVEVVLLSLTKKDLPSYANKEVLEGNYIFMGLIKDSNLPFFLYCHKTGIGAAKNFLTSVHSSKRPMWSFVTQLESEVAKTEKDGKKYTFYKIKFSIREEINDLSQLKVYHDLVEKYRDVLKSEKESVEESEDLLSSTDDLVADVVPNKREVLNENVDPETIPF